MDFSNPDLGSPVAYVVAFALPLIDGVIPLVPAQALTVAIGAAAAGGDWRAFLLLALAAAGAWCSDNIAYWIGRRHGEKVARMLLRGKKGEQAREWGERQLRERGTPLVVLARVIPGGPTPITLAAGLSNMAARRFRWAAAAGAVIWAGYGFVLGAIGTGIGGGSWWIGLLVGLALLAVVNGIVAGINKLRKRGR
jgi:membrane protein DedA with SNARE-associated domain